MGALTLIVGCQGLGSLWAQGSSSGGENPGSSTTGSEAPTGEGTSGGTGGASGSDDGASLLFDLDSPGVDPGYDDPSIPPTCVAAAEQPTSLGCVFFAVDLDQALTAELESYALAFGNVQPTTPATVVVEAKNDGVWETVVPAVVVGPLEVAVVPLPDRHREGTGVSEGGAYRVRSDRPISVHQFSPIDGGKTHSSDASLLLPVTAWTSHNAILGLPTDDEVTQAGYFTVVAGFDGTTTVITPSASFVPGGGVPTAPPGVDLLIPLNEGDIVEIAAAHSVGNEVNFGLSGTAIVSGGEHPVAVFSGHACASIPAGNTDCSHVQEMVSPDHYGEHFVATRMPVRDSIAPESTLWQILATEDGTRITFEGGTETLGLPDGPIVLSAGEVYEVYVTGITEPDGDFVIDADAPIAVAGYMTDLEGEAQPGGAAMVQLAPVDRFLPRYVIHVPYGWDRSVLTITRRTGEMVLFDGQPVPEAIFSPVDPGHDVGRLEVAAGPHIVSGFEPVGVMVAGIGLTDAYAYLGGSGRPVISIDPEG